MPPNRVGPGFLTCSCSVRPARVVLELQLQYRLWQRGAAASGTGMEHTLQQLRVDDGHVDHWLLHLHYGEMENRFRSQWASGFRLTSIIQMTPTHGFWKLKNVRQITRTLTG